MTTDQFDFPDDWVRTDFAWADVLLDCRDPQWREFDLPTAIPETGEPALPEHVLGGATAGNEEHSLTAHLGAKLTLPERAFPADQIAALGLRPDYRVAVEGFTLTHPRSMGHVMARLTFPDRYRVAALSPERGDEVGMSPAALWHQHFSAPRGGMAITLMREPRKERATLLGAEALRRAVAEPGRWLAGWSLGDGDDSDVAADMYHLASMGFGNYLTARMAADNRTLAWSEWLDAVEGGFRLDNPNHVAWILAADRGDWMTCHDSWRDLLRLRDEGWSLPALDILHDPKVLRLITALAAKEHIDRQAGGLHALWADVSRAREWVRMTRSASDASVCLEAGVSLDEIREWTMAGAMPDIAALRMMAALKRNASTDKP